MEGKWIYNGSYYNSDTMLQAYISAMTPKRTYLFELTI
jgi:hypothetical protein